MTEENYIRGKADGELKGIVDTRLTNVEKEIRQMREDIKEYIKEMKEDIKLLVTTSNRLPGNSDFTRWHQRPAVRTTSIAAVIVAIIEGIRMLVISW